MSSTVRISICSARASRRPTAIRRWRTWNGCAARWPRRIGSRSNSRNRNKKAAGVVLNAGGYTHSSVAIRDAIAAIRVPVIEVHISNVFAREDFRHFSHIAPVARATLSGFGIHGYALAISGLAALIDGED